MLCGNMAGGAVTSHFLTGKRNLPSSVSKKMTTEVTESPYQVKQNYIAIIQASKILNMKIVLSYILFVFPR